MSKAKLVLGIDLEGINKDLIFNGLDLKVDRVSEIGAVLWNWEYKQPVKILSKIINEEKRLNISTDLEELTGLNDDILNNYGVQNEDIPNVLLELSSMMESADYLMAHNGTNYDYPMLKALFERHNVKWIDRIWIDTQVDIEYPKMLKARSLAMLEHFHGFLNPFPYRALTDVLSMLKIASKYSLDRMVKLASCQKIRVVANLDAPNWKKKKEVDEFNYHKNRIAKSGFRWDPYEKYWYKEVPQIYIDEDKLQFNFSWYISKD